MNAPKCRIQACQRIAITPQGFCIHCDPNAACIKNDAPPFFDMEASEDKTEKTTAQKYPKYYKSVTHLDEIDVYQVHNLFNIQDPSGAIQHASKKLLLSGVRTGNKTQYKDIQEARDTLNRWLEMNASLKD